MRSFGWAIGVALIGVLGLVAFVRLSSNDPARWHTPVDTALWDDAAPWDKVVARTGAATLRLSPAKGAPADLLARLDAVALGTPRTKRLAGSLAEGRITWVTRSALWGFPDFTTAEQRDDGLYIHARLRFGREDMGVNAARLQQWLAAL